MKNALGIEQIGVNDNFFELGGDSLNIVQLNGKLKKVLNRDIPVAAMFSYLTVRSFFEYIKHKELDDGTISGGIDRSEEIERSKNRLKARTRRK